MIFLNWLDIDWHKIDTGKKLIDIDWYMIGFQILTDLTFYCYNSKIADITAFFQKFLAMRSLTCLCYETFLQFLVLAPPFLEAGLAPVDIYTITGSWKSTFNWYGIKLEINWSIIDWYSIIDEVNWSDIDWYIIGLKILIDYWLIFYFQYWVSLEQFKLEFLILYRVN